MNLEHLKILRCPRTKRSLELMDRVLSDNRIQTGTLIEPISGNKYPIINYIPRFCCSENYTYNFGVEWNIHNKTQ